MAGTFGKYELIRKIASGGMAEVFLARQSGEIGGFSKTVAIKRIFAHVADEPDAKMMVFDEARIAASFNHPNIVQIYELGQEGDHLYIAMEYVHGRDLKRVFEEGHQQAKILPINMAVSIVAQAAAGLEYAHRQTDEEGLPMEVIHRDVSPQNVLLSADGHVKLCDFGIAKANDRLGHTKEGQFKGKVSYMSPEQFDTALIDQRADIYSLGVVLYEATTGQKLYCGESDMENIALLARGDFATPSEISAGYPSDLEKIVMKAIEREPDARYQTAEELQNDLEAWLDSNQARASAAQLARYLRGLFPELAKPPRVSGEFKAVSRDDVRSSPATRDARDQGLDEAFDAPPTVIIEPDEDDSDAGERRELTEEPVAASKVEVESSLARESEAQGHRVLVSRDDDVGYSDMLAGIESTDADEVGEETVSITRDELDATLSQVSDEADETVSMTRDELESQRKSWSESPPVAKPPTPAAGLSKELPGPPRRRPSELGPPAEKPAAESLPETRDMARPDLIASVKPRRARPDAGRQEPGPSSESPPGPAKVEESSVEPSGARPAPGPAAHFRPPSGAAPPRGSRPPSQNSPQVSPQSPESGSGAPGPSVPEGSPAHRGAEASDALIEDWAPTKNKTKIYAFLGLIGFVAVILLVFAINASSENQLKTEAEAKLIDPELLEMDEPPEVATVAIAMESDPPGASFVVNGLPAETENGRIVVREGIENEVVATLSGYRPLRRFVRGSASASPEPFALQPIDSEGRASLAVISEPREARIWLNGDDAGVTPTTLQNLPSGIEHHIAIEREGRFGYSGMVQLVPGSENEVTADLLPLDSPRKNYVELRITAVPRGATVSVDGEMTAMTPFNKNMTRYGVVEIELDDPDHRRERRIVALDRVGTLEIRPFLEKEERQTGRVSVSVDVDDATLYIGNTEYGSDPVRRLELREGSHPIVLEYQGMRLRATIDVEPGAHVEYDIGIQGRDLVVRRSGS